MKTSFPASTGLPGLDEVLNGLRLGDNVVWQVDEIEDYRHFVLSLYFKCHQGTEEDRLHAVRRP